MPENRSMDRATRLVVLCAAALLCARGLGCQSAPGTPASSNAGTGGAAAAGTGGAVAGTGGAGTTGASGATGVGGMSGVSGSGDGGNTGGGDGGVPACHYYNGQAGSWGGPPCGVQSCDGNTVVLHPYCNACSGPTAPESIRTPCDPADTCVQGFCLAHSMTPTKACTVPTDCTLPASLCVGQSQQMVFSDPTCDEGQCHWKQIVNDCNNGFPQLACSGGTCFDPGMMTRGPVTPMPTAAKDQPPAPPAHSCTKAADCPSPPRGCWGASEEVTYVNPACRAGACAWEINLSECTGGCGDGGACATP
jgi:hypothetical protein